MPSKTYWARRAASDMRRRVEAAEELNRELLTDYVLASKYLQSEAEGVFTKYQSRYGLTVPEAEYLLKKVRTPDDVAAILRELEKDPKNAGLLAELEAGAYGARLRRVSSMQQQVDRITRELADVTQAGLNALLPDIAEDAFYRTIYNIQQEAGFYIPFEALSKDKIAEILRRRWAGSDFSSRIWKNAELLAKELKHEIMVDLLTGRSLVKATRALAEKMHAGYNNTRRVVRTESTYVSNELHAKSYEELGVEQYIYVAILDLRTSKICRSLDKKIFNVKDRKVGTNYPPMHPYCRSTTIAWLPPALLKNMRQRALDPKTGQSILVPLSMTYEEWYNQYVKGESKGTAPAETLRFASSTAKKLKPLIDITEEWKAEVPLEEPDVTIATEYVAPDGTVYTVDGNDVVQDHKPGEIEVARIVSTAKGERVEMQPRVNKPEGVSTPDAKIGGIAYEIKTSGGNGENALVNAIKRGKKQAGRIILDVRNSPLASDEIERQIGNVKIDDHIKFVEELVIVNSDGVLVLSR